MVHGPINIRKKKAVCISYRIIAEHFVLYRDTAHCPIQLCRCHCKQLLTFLYLFFTHLVLYSPDVAVSHHVRHNNSASLIEQWHICHRYLDLAVVLSTVRRLWKRSASQGFEVALQCASLIVLRVIERSVFLTTLLLFLRVYSIGSIWMNMENWWVKLKYSEKTCTIHRLAWDRTYASGVRGRRLARMNHIRDDKHICC